jgi:hypothetical protein
MNIRGMYSIHEAEREIFITNLSTIYSELRNTLFDTPLRLMPQRNVNGVETIKQTLETALRGAGWTTGSVPIASYPSGGSKLGFLKVLHEGVGLAVVVQFGYESRIQDDFSRMQEAQVQKVCNAGVLIVPVSDTAQYLTDRVATFEAAVRTFEAYPNSYRDLRLLVVGIGHDATTDEPLPKQHRRRLRG